MYGAKYIISIGVGMGRLAPLDQPLFRSFSDSMFVCQYLERVPAMNTSFFRTERHFGIHMNTSTLIAPAATRKTSSLQNRPKSNQISKLSCSFLIHSR